MVIAIQGSRYSRFSVFKVLGIRGSIGIQGYRYSGL